MKPNHPPQVPPSVISLPGKLLATLLPAILAGLASAEDYRFDLNRFGYISLKTAKDAAKVAFVQGDKQGEETTWQSKLKATAPQTFATPGGTVFKLEKLAKPVVNDGNRQLNSGSWKLTISGEGREFAEVRKKIPFIAFGDNGKTEYYGGKAE